MKALLASASGAIFRPAIPIEAQSAVGAGDSFLAAMLFALSAGWSLEHAFAYGMAGGAAAVLSPGTDLCRKADVERLFAAYP
jgi:6-phosphofructokinase 2